MVGTVTSGGANNSTGGIANNFVLSSITSVKHVTARGLINPFTLSGTIVVDEIAASVYNHLMGSEARMHAFTVFIRWMYKASPELMQMIHSSGFEKFCQSFLTGLLSLGNREGAVGAIAHAVISLPSKLLAEPF
jgi:hypothetical protein